MDRSRIRGRVRALRSLQRGIVNRRLRSDGRIHRECNRRKNESGVPKFR